MMKRPLVSVIVPTYNSAPTLKVCLKSIKSQSYKKIELVVIDNFSKDTTPNIAKEYADTFMQIGPERSAQRNYGVKQSHGSIILIIDSDMELSEKVVEQCVSEFVANPNINGLVIPEESFGTGFWAQCKKLERSFYVGVPWMEAARAYRKETYLAVGGYDETMVSGEDWDLSQRIANLSYLGRVEAFILHNEGHLKLVNTLKKKYYYANKFVAYTSKNKHTNILGQQTGILKRYKLFFYSHEKLFANPLIGFGMLIMKSLEFIFGSLGYLSPKLKLFKSNNNIILLGSYGHGNLGDDALLLAAVALLSRYSITANFTNSAPLPKKALKSIGIIDVKGFNNWHYNINTFLKAKAVVYGGGGLWVELEGERYPRKPLWSMLIINVISRLFFKKVIYLGNDGGSLEGLSLMLAKITARLSTALALRNNKTKNMLGIKKAIVVPDLTIKLFPTTPSEYSRNTRDKDDILISVIYYVPNAKTEFQTYIKSLASCINTLDLSKYNIKLFPMLPTAETKYNDTWACKELLKHINIKRSVSIVIPTSLDNCLELITSADIVVGTRLHACILSTWLGKPTIGLSYRPKVSRFFEDNGIGSNCISLNELDSLCSKIVEVSANKEIYAQQSVAVWKDNHKKGLMYDQFIQNNI